MNSEDIIKLLRLKHHEDVFVPECKDGPTQSVQSYSRMDAWVMPRSWSNPSLIGYEVKVTRSDFLGDTKWRNYLTLCNYLYFVAPPGVILANELPPEIGFLEVSKTGTRLFTKKKAMYREIPDPSSLFRYVLMCRSKIVSEFAPANHRGYWKEWLEKREIDHVFGLRVSKSIGETVEKKILEVERENSDLQKKMAAYDAHIRLLKSLGLGDDCSELSFGNKLKDIRSGLSHQDQQAIARVAELMPQIAAKLT